MRMLSEEQLARLGATLVEVSRRLTARGEPVRYLRSTLLVRDGRLLSWFEAADAESVRRVNESAQAPYISVEAGIEVPAPT